LDGLDAVPGLRVVFQNADATVYAVDRAYVEQQAAREGAHC
jgi:hypothetical protein